MVGITILVKKRANNFDCYTKDLLEDIYHQFHSGMKSSNVSLMSGHLSLSVAPYILASISPMLKSILLENDSLSCIMVHNSFAKVLPGLVNLLYTGQVSNITKQEAELLMLLAKELGMMGIVMEAGQNISNVKGRSRGTEMNKILEGRAGAVAIHSPLKGKDSDKFSLDSTSVSYEDVRDTDAIMCPPLEPETIRFFEPSSVLLADKGKQEDDQINFVESFNASDDHRELIEVVTVLDHDVDEIVENVGGSLNGNISSYVVKDAFFASDSEVNPFKAERCNICDQDFRSRYELLDHLTMTHYKAKLAQSFSEYGRICPSCEDFRDDHEDNLNHIGRDHEVVYDYYKADNFANDGDESNGCKNPKKKISQEEHTSIEQNITHGRNSKDSSSSVALKGILKSTGVHQKDPPKSILRVSRPKSPSVKKSILKQPKSLVKSLKNQVELKVDKMNVENVLLSVQDNCGDIIVDIV